MGSCCGSKPNVKYLVTFADKTTQTYNTVAEAQKALDAAGPGGTFKAVPA